MEVVRLLASLPGVHFGALAVVRAVGGEAHGDPVDRVPKGSGQVWAKGHSNTYP